MSHSRLLSAALTCLAILAGPAGLRAEFQLLLEPDSTVYVLNASSEWQGIDGYQIASMAGNLDPGLWWSISDAVRADPLGILELEWGQGAIGFGEANPSTSSVGELNIAGALQVPSGARWRLGKPLWGAFAEIAAKVGTAPGVPDQDFAFFYHRPGTVEQIRGDIIAVPEPSAVVLALSGLVACLALRRRPCAGA